ncbi:restriction endonuclease subunit S [Thiocystis violascens]|nr:restriction endonuclease subunit S [Thiocystis violascens]
MSGLGREWRECKLDDLGSVGRGKSRHRPRNDTSLYGGKYPFVQTGDVKEAEFRLTKYSQTYNEKGLAQSKLWEPGTLCITIAANIADTAILGIPACFPDSVVGFVADQNKADVRFIKYSIDTLKLEMQGASRGTTQDNLSVDKLITFNFRVPPLPIQHRIADILSAYDDLIENNQRRIQILENMARSLYREWFVEFRFPGHENVKFVDSPLGKIPEGWEIGPMESVCDRITDGAHHSPKTQELGYPMASVKDMHDWGINIESCRKISEEDFKELERNDSTMRKNDVLIAKDGSYLKHCFVVEEDMQVALLSSIAILRPNHRFKPHLLAIMLRDPDVKLRMKGYVSGAALPRIILKEFRHFNILMPPINLQEHWSRLCEPMLEMCWRLIAKNQNLRRTRDLLLPRLLSGQLDVSTLPEETIP